MSAMPAYRTEVSRQNDRGRSVALPIDGLAAQAAAEHPTADLVGLAELADLAAGLPAAAGHPRADLTAASTAVAAAAAHEGTGWGLAVRPIGCSGEACSV